MSSSGEKEIAFTKRYKVKKRRPGGMLTPTGVHAGKETAQRMKSIKVSLK